MPTPAPTQTPTPPPTPTPTRPPTAEPEKPLLLRVWHPIDNSEVPSNAVVVVGLTSPGAIVTINDRIVKILEDGGIQAEAFLEPGTNLIRVEATDSQGNQEQTELIVTSLALPPQPFTLLVTEPADQSRVFESSVRLVGRTNPESELQVNGVGIPVDPLLGIFSTEIALVPGPNVINVKATARDGREINKVIAVIRR